MLPKPDPAPSQSTIRAADRVTPSGDALLLQQALSAASQGDWSRALSLSEQSTQRVVKDIIEWRYVLDEDSGASFDAINSFLAAHPRWPRHDAMVIRAEKAMPPDYAPAQVIAWYGTRLPLSGTGMIRLGEALMQTGRSADGAALIKSFEQMRSRNISEASKLDELITVPSVKHRIFMAAVPANAIAMLQSARMAGELQVMASSMLPQYREWLAALKNSKPPIL